MQHHQKEFLNLLQNNSIYLSKKTCWAYRWGFITQTQADYELLSSAGMCALTCAFRFSACLNMYTPPAFLVPTEARRKKKELNPLVLELHTIVSHHMSSGN